MMRTIQNIFTVARQTFTTLFFSPMAYVSIIIFLILSGLYGFMLGNFMTSNDASLFSFFDGYRWVFLILIPPMGMQMWSEEQKNGTFELMMSLPVSTWNCVVGKFLGGMGVILLALLLTFPTVVTVYYLGAPDTGAIVCGYIGAILLAGTYLSICTMASAMTKNQSIAFVFGTILCVLINLFGLQSLADVLTGALMPISEFTQELSIRTHYTKFLRGIIDTQNLYYFVALTVFGLFTTGIILWIHRIGGLRDALTLWVLQKNHTLKSFKTASIHSYFTVFIMLVLLICGGIIASRFRTRIDFTEDHMFTLSPASVQAIKSIENETVIRLYVSRDKIRKWPQMENYATRIEDLLTEYAQAGHGKIRIEKYDVRPRTVAEESAIIDGLSGVHVENIGRVWFGMVVATKNTRVKIPQLMPITESRLEYEITQAIHQLNLPERKRVGVWSPLPVAGMPNQSNPLQSLQPWGCMVNLAKNYTIQFLPQILPELDPKELPLLILIHPSNMSPANIYAMDQYLLRGGRLLIFADPNCFYAAFAPKRIGIEIPTEMISANFIEPYVAWGIRMAPDQVVADMTIARFDEESKLRDPSVLMPSKAQGNLNPTHPVTQKLKQMMLWYSGYIQGEARENLTVIPLITSTKDVCVIDKRMAHKRDEVVAGFTSDEQPRSLAVEIFGKFPSIFQAGRPAAFNPKFRIPHLSESAIPGKVILVCDVDMLFDPFGATSIPNPFDARIPVSVPNNDNNSFFMNAVDYLMGQNEMIGVRGERALIRPFTRLQNMRTDIEQKVIAEERNYVNELYNLEEKLTELRRDPNSDISEMEETEQKLNKVLDTITDINLYRDRIAALENKLFILNVALLPILVGIFALIFLTILYYRRRAR